MVTETYSLFSAIRISLPKLVDSTRCLCYNTAPSSGLRKDLLTHPRGCGYCVLWLYLVWHSPYWSMVFTILMNAGVPLLTCLLCLCWHLLTALLAFAQWKASSHATYTQSRMHRVVTCPYAVRMRLKKLGIQLQRVLIFIQLLTISTKCHTAVVLWTSPWRISTGETASLQWIDEVCHLPGREA